MLSCWMQITAWNLASSEASSVKWGVGQIPAGMLALRVMLLVKKFQLSPGLGAGRLQLAMVLSQSGCKSVFILGPAADRLISILWDVL